MTKSISLKTSSRLRSLYREVGAMGCTTAAQFLCSWCWTAPILIPHRRSRVRYEILGEYQARSLEMMIDDLPEEVFDLGRQLPEFVRENFSSSMSPWEVKASILYNPDLKFIDFAMPGIVGLILQLLTVTLTASSSAESAKAVLCFNCT